MFSKILYSDLQVPAAYLLEIQIFLHMRKEPRK